MSKQTVFFVGKAYLHFLDWLLEENYTVYHLFDQKEKYDLDRYFVDSFPLDLSTEQSFKAGLAAIPVKPDLILNCTDNSMRLKARICQYYQLPGPTTESATVSSDKFLMRQAFQKYCPTYSPQFAQVNSWSDIEDFLANPQIAFPLILKPANLSKSLMVSKANSKEELKEIYQDSISQAKDIYLKENVFLEPSFVIEECLIGPAYSIEAFCDEKGQVVTAPTAVDLIMARDININDNYNYSRKLPSQLNSEQQAAISQAAIAGCQALKLSSVLAHVELFYTAQGPKIIEIGAREGGFRRKMHLLSQGIDFNFAKILVAQGKLPTFDVQKNDGCAVYELFPEKEGNFVEVENLDQLQSLPSFYDFDSKRKVGEKIGLARQGYRAVGAVTLTHHNPEQFEKDCVFLETQVRVKVN